MNFDSWENEKNFLLNGRQECIDFSQRIEIRIECERFSKETVEAIIKQITKEQR